MARLRVLWLDLPVINFGLFALFVFALPVIFFGKYFTDRVWWFFYTFGAFILIIWSITLFAENGKINHTAGNWLPLILGVVAFFIGAFNFTKPKESKND